MKVVVHAQADAARGLAGAGDGALQVLFVRDVQVVVAEEVVEILRRQLEAMPALMRDIFIASRTEELSHKEIAARFHISERRVKYELKKALDTLKESFRDYLPAFFILWAIDLLMQDYR